MSRIFNLLAPDNIEVSGYRLTRVANYDQVIQQLPKRGSVTTSRVSASDGRFRWVHSQEHKQGLNVHTFDASWVGVEPEPKAMLVQEAPLLADLLLLFTMWGERRVFHRPDNLDPTESPYYWPDWYILGGSERFKAVEVCVHHLRKNGIPRYPFNKVLHLLIECDRSDIAEVKGLIFMPCLDLVSAAAPHDKAREWTKDQQSELEDIRKGLLAALDAARDLRVIADAAGPFRSDVRRLGSDRAADKLIDYYRWALDWLTLPDDVVVSHAKALNAVRNALIHRAASPEKISVRFTARTPMEIPRDDPPEHLLRAQLSLTIVNHAILKRHASALLGLPTQVMSQLDADLRDFFARGIYNDVRVFEEWFQDRIIG